MKKKGIIKLVGGGYLTVTYRGSYECFDPRGRALGERETFTEAVATVAASVPR